MNSPNSAINNSGKLRNDQPFEFKIIGTYNFPLGFRTGWFFRHESGPHWTPIIGVFGHGPYFTYWGEPVGTRKLPAHNTIDMRIEKEFPVLHGQLRLTFDIFNVFNNSYVLWVYPYFNGRLGQPLIYNRPREMKMGVRYIF